MGTNEKKAALVTGATHGIGLELAKLLLKNEWTVFGTGRSRAATLKLKESSIYCASKAGLDEVAAIVRQELAEKNIGVTCIIPGEVDTKIQKILRETTSFHLHHLFVEAHEKGQLISPKICAEFLKWILCDLPFNDFKLSNIPVSIYDQWHHQFWLKDANQLPAFPF